MKKYIFILVFLLSFIFSKNLNAQAPQQIATINSIELLEATPGKAEAEKIINDLNNKYKDELRLMQNDYNKKYSDFVSYQNSMAENIRLRRMQELYELEQQINNFMKVAQDDIQSKENELISPLRKKVQEAVTQVGIENGFICIYDLANPAIAFVTPDAINAIPLVKLKLGIK